MSSDPLPSTHPASAHLAEVALFFLKLGVTAFGGPAAHIAMMHDELVKRRKWLNEQQFLDLLGATHLIPGPNSTEMTIHLGFVRAGWPGLIAGGVCFIIPAALITLALAWVYVQYGATPVADNLLYGIKPVIIAIIGQALWSLAPKAIKGALTAGVGLITLLLHFLGFDEISLLFCGGAAVMIGQNWRRLRQPGPGVWAVLLPGLSLPGPAAGPVNLLQLFLLFLKIGSVLYGSGYVLLAFLRTDFVTRLGWLTDQQLLDAISIGQITPGPVFTTATFIGYILAGVPGAVLATLGIFLPSFIFVALSNPLIPKLRNSPWTGGLLDGVNVASLALMATVTWQLGRASLVDPLTIGLALLAAGLLWRFKVNSTWLILGGAVAGLLADYWQIR
ncbi:MAG: chromate efflux transporter [Anaerolineales bacterium]|nr:chromate efflux transporter [Anaerolineales bacterium]